MAYDLNDLQLFLQVVDHGRAGGRSTVDEHEVGRAVRGRPGEVGVAGGVEVGVHLTAVGSDEGVSARSAGRAGDRPRRVGASGR